MKKIVFIIALQTYIFCVYAQQNVYYYYGDRKIYLDECMDKMFVKFSSTDWGESSLSSLGVIVDKRAQFAVVKSTTTVNTRRVISNLRNRSDVVSITPLLQYDGGFQGLTDEFIVRLKSTTLFSDLQDLVLSNAYTIKEKDKFVDNQYIILVPKISEFNSMQAANQFYETGLFVFSEPNFVFTNILFNSGWDRYSSYQWALENGDIGIDINVKPAWEVALGTDVKVALIDNGVDLTHPDLNVNLLPGYDATGHNSNGAPVFLFEDHGTACAGIIGAIKGNGHGIVGVAPECKIVPIHVTFGDDATNEWLADAIRWSYKYGNADVISNSWGGGSPTTNITSAIDSATIYGRNNLGCVVVFASGNSNNNSVSFPSCLSNVIAVGAINKCGVRATRNTSEPLYCYPWQCPPSNPDCDLIGSNYGINLDIVAPGSKIFTTDIQGGAGYNNDTDPSDNGDYYANFGGTSAACPHVAGIAALVLSVNPYLTQKQVRDIVENTARKLIDYDFQENVSERPNGSWNEEVGYGLVDAYAAVKLAQISNPNNSCETTYVSDEIYYNDLPEFKKKSIVVDCEVEITNTIIEAPVDFEVIASNEIRLFTNFHAQLGSNVHMRIVQMEINNNSCVFFTPNILKVTGKDYEISEQNFILMNDELLIYPNPTKDWINIRYKNPERVQYITINNLQGVCVAIFSNHGISGEIQTDISNFPTGVYFLMLHSIDGLKNLKLIKQ